MIDNAWEVIIITAKEQDHQIENDVSRRMP